MEYYIAESDVRNYIKLPHTFDWGIVDQDSGFAQIFKIFPLSVYQYLKTTENDGEKEIYRLLTKAVTHYAFIFSIPRIKTQITNFGILEFSADKTKASAWWDIRDLGISLLKEADRCFSEAISLAAKIESLKLTIPFFQKQKYLFDTPADLEAIYSINNSVDVFINMQQFLERAYKNIQRDKLKSCVLESFMTDVKIKSSLLQAIVYFALADASRVSKFLFLQSAVVVQYDELPWQKSQILSHQEKMQAGHNFYCLAEDSLKEAIQEIKTNPELYPCYNAPGLEYSPNARDSFISLF